MAITGDILLLTNDAVNPGNVLKKCFVMAFVNVDRTSEKHAV